MLTRLLKCIPLTLLTISLSTLFTPELRAAETVQISESQAKAILLFNLARYVSWPTNKFKLEDVVEIGILSRNPPDNSWDIIRGKTVHGRRIIIRKSSDIYDLTSCEILYIDRSFRKELPRVLAQIKGEPVLTVSEIDNFHKNTGGMIWIRTEGSRLVFSVNLATSRKSGIDISSHVLKLAHEVIQ